MVHFLFDPSLTGYDSTVFIFQKGGGGGSGNGENDVSDTVISETTTTTNNNDSNVAGGADHGRNKYNINGPGSYFFTGSAPFQRGYGGIGRLHHRRGSLGAFHRLVRYRQRGSGIGDILRGLWRILFPVIRKAGHKIGREGLSTGERILNKLSQGENLKQTVISEGKRGVDNLLAEGGLPKQFGTGATVGGDIGDSRIKKVNRRKKQTKKYDQNSFLPSHQTLIGRAVKVSNPKTGKNDKSFGQKSKRIRSDTFGFY